MDLIFRSLKQRVSVALVALSVVTGMACTPSHPMSTFDTLGPVAKSQLDLFYVIFWVGLVIVVLVTAAVIYISLRFKRVPGQADPEQTHGHTVLEIIWTVIPTLLLAVIAVPSVMTIFDNARSPHPPEKGGLEIIATGHQWWFEFDYPQHGITTANELHIPIGQPVNIKLESKDVIHSFWIPKIAGKLDMVPNNDNNMWIQANEPGEYFGQCAEFCGEAHANMKFKLIAQTQIEFASWLESTVQDALIPSDGLAKEGEILFMSREGGCFACHTIQGTQRARGTVGPNLTHFASRKEFAGSILENTQQNLREWIENPDKMKPGNIMARDAGVYNGSLLPLTEPQVSALVAYLRSLK